MLRRLLEPVPDGEPARRAAASAAGICALGAAVLFALFHSLRHDDAFVTFQYARHLAEGQGFVFNPGERVLGTTSPLHTLLLALLHPFAKNALPTAAVALGCLGIAAQAFVSFLLLRRSSLLIAAAAPALILTGFIDGLPFLSLETNLFAALALATVWALSERRAVLCGVFLGLCFLTRYDGALLVPIVAVFWWLRFKELPKVPLLVSFAVVAPWLIFATIYFGSFLPQTFFAKQRISEPLEYLAHYADYFSSWSPAMLLGTSALWARLPFLALAVAGAVVTTRTARQLLPFLAFAALLVLAYAAMGPHFLQHWHLYPALLALQLLEAIGLIAALRRIPAAALAGSLLLIIGTADRQLAHPHALLDTYWLNGRNARYEEISSWLKANVRSDSSLMALEVGTLGYDSGLRMIDPYGLINDTNAYPRDPTLPNLLELVDRYHPDLLLVNTVEQGDAIARLTPYRTLKVFGPPPASTLLAR